MLDENKRFSFHFLTFIQRKYDVFNLSALITTSFSMIFKILKVDLRLKKTLLIQDSFEFYHIHIWTQDKTTLVYNFKRPAIQHKIYKVLWIVKLLCSACLCKKNKICAGDDEEDEMRTSKDLLTIHDYFNDKQSRIIDHRGLRQKITSVLFFWRFIRT